MTHGPLRSLVSGLLLSTFVLSSCAAASPEAATTSQSSESPTTDPTTDPTDAPTETPTDEPTDAATETPTDTPTEPPASPPTETPTATPTDTPTDVPTDGPPDVPVPQDGPPPNIVFITTDDQRADEMAWMPHTTRLLGEHGVTFTTALSPHPLCCPARAEWITGQYGQNNGVHHNAGKFGGFPALRSPTNTLPVWLSKQGYQTAMAGKFMNGYHDTDGAQPGWTHWNATIDGTYSYTNTTFFNDGKKVTHKGEHVDDVVGDYAQKYIREFSRSDAPFFVWASNLSPHTTPKGGGWAPPKVADRHRKLFANSRPLSTKKGSYNKPTRGWKDKNDPEAGRASIRDSHLARIRSLQTVDEGVRDIVNTLREVGELDNTIIVFTSDNGYLLGEHDLMAKNLLYAEALHVPLLVRLPAQTSGTTQTTPVTVVDIAPTFVALTGASTGGRVMDGTSFTPLLDGTDMAWRDTQLIQTGITANKKNPDGWSMRGVRTARYTYAKALATGKEMLFDRERDRYERVNVANKKTYRRVLRVLRKRTRILSTCVGAACNEPFGKAPRPGKNKK